MTRTVLVILLVAVVAVVGCNKKQEEIDAIEQEATERELTAFLDSLEKANSEKGARQVTDVQSIATSTPVGPETVSPTAEIPPPEPPPAETTATEPAKPPETLPGAHPAGGYVVQIGSYADSALADKIAEKYRRQGFPAFLQEVEVTGKTYYRLRIGAYDTYAKAQEIGRVLTEKYALSYWIDDTR